MSKKPTYEELEKKVQELEQAESERKQIEDALRLSEHKVFTHLQYTPIGALSWDLNFKAIEWNPAAEDIFGYTKEEAIGKHVTKLILPEDMKELVDDIFQDLLSEKGGARSTNENITKDGRRIMCDWYNTTLKDINGKVIGVASLVHDITKREEAVRALKEQKEFNEKIIQTSNAIIVGIDKNHKVKIFNRGAEKITGYKSEEVVGNDWFKLFFKPEIYNEMDKVWKDAWGTKFHSYVNPIHAKNGTLKMISWQTTGMYEGTDESEHMLISIGEDITERRQAEEMLKYSKLQFEAVVNNLDSAIYIADMKSNEILFMNQHMKDEFGEDLTGKICWQVIHNNQDAPCEFCTNDRLIDADGNPKKPYVWEFYNQILENWYELRDQVIPWLDGRLVRMEIATDITERRETEDALRESEAKYRDLVENINEVIYAVDKNGLITYLSPAIESKSGYNREELIGLYLSEFAYHEDLPRLMEQFPKILSGHLERSEYRLVAKSGEVYWVSASSRPVYEGDQVVGLTGVMADITESKRLQAQLLQSQKMESIGTLTGGVAHDFNNILYMITGNAELALEDIPEWNPVHNNLKEIKAAGLRAAGIVNQLLNFSRKTDLKLKPIGAITVIKDALKFIRSTIPATVQIRKHLPDRDITILADPTQIHQVVMNLCTNASQAMEETGGILEINVEKETLTEDSAGSYPGLTAGEYIKITVSDTGPGIDTEIIDRIFDPYFTTKEFGKGSGMGLTVVHGIVKNHGGAITVDSEPEKGATFTILFPVVSEKPVAVVKTPDEIPLGTETILFVDDEKSIVNIIGKMLERLGYKVETKLNPVDALELFQSKPDEFDLVITDMTMPQMTGVKLSEKLKDVRSDIPVIICTGHSSQIDEEKAKELGIAAYVMKPIVMSGFAKTIRLVLDETNSFAQG